MWASYCFAQVTLVLIDCSMVFYRVKLSGYEYNMLLSTCAVQRVMEGM